MSNRFQWVIVLPLFAVIGCGEERPVMSTASQMTTPAQPCQLSNLVLGVEKPVGNPIVLRACPIKDHVLMEEPIRVLVAVLNVAEGARKVGAHFAYGDWLRALIVTSAGDTLEQSAIFDGPGARDVAVRLVRGGFVGRVVDLTCTRNDYVEFPRSDCGALYTLPAGQYKVTMYFSYLCEGDGCPTGFLRVTRLFADPFDVVVEEGVYRAPPPEPPRPRR